MIPSASSRAVYDLIQTHGFMVSPSLLHRTNDTTIVHGLDNLLGRRGRMKGKEGTMPQL